MKRSDRPSDGARKGAQTRQRILRHAAVLFNTRGFAGTSISDVSAATGLEKGGVYNHFASKDELALAAFDLAAEMVIGRLAGAARAGADGPARLESMFAVYRELHEQPFLTGGCPIMNTAIEADDTHSGLRDRARIAMRRWLALVADALEAGRSEGQFRADLDITAAAGTIVAGLEGGILLTGLFSEPSWMTAVTAQLAAYVDSLRVAA